MYWPFLKPDVMQFCNLIITIWPIFNPIMYLIMFCMAVRPGLQRSLCCIEDTIQYKEAYEPWTKRPSSCFSQPLQRSLIHPQKPHQCPLPSLESYTRPHCSILWFRFLSDSLVHLFTSCFWQTLPYFLLFSICFFSRVEGKALPSRSIFLREFACW